MQFEASESREGKDDLYGNVAESETSLPVDVYIHDFVHVYVDIYVSVNVRQQVLLECSE